MSKVSITRSLLDNLATSISVKSGEPIPMTLTEMKDAVDGISGGGTPTLQTKTKIYTPTESQQTEAVTADSGYDGLSEVDVTVNAVSSTYVGTGITRRSSTDLTASGATVTAPSGYYSEQASKAVASGTAGTPTATKGAVNNHAVNVTPSVTNTTGYIAGGTKTGTAVSVSASELVSGTLSVTSNDTYDVTNYASVSVNVPTGGGGASNIVEGTFTTGSSAGYTNISTGYTGSGYPLSCIVVVEDGAYNSSVSPWYSSVQRYAVGMWSMTKAVFDSTPTYSTSGSANYGVTCAIYKNSTSSSTSYTRTSGMGTNVYSSSNASNAALTCVRLHSGNVLSYYVNTSSYGLLPNTTYRYIITYSS